MDAQPIPPTHANVAYGSHPRQCMDVWLCARAPRHPTPLFLYLHGGGYAAGDKSSLPPRVLEGLLQRGVSVAAGSYRYTTAEEPLAPLRDGARLVQFLRHRADCWGLDGSRLGAGGCSAGAATAFYLGLGSDLAQPAAADPVARQSTRLQCIAGWEAQTTLDPRYIRSLIAGPAWTITSIQKLTGLTAEQYDAPEARPVLDGLHFLRGLGPDSPPVFLYNLTPDLPMTQELSIGNGIHHPRFGQDLQRRRQAMGVECVHRMAEQEPTLSPESRAQRFQEELAAFVARHLLAR